MGRPAFEEKIFSLDEEVAPLVACAFPIAEIYDAERHWEDICPKRATS